MGEDKDFLRQDNNYRTLLAFRKAECIYDVTYFFAHKFLSNGDRTVDQTRAFGKTHLDSAIYRERIKDRSDETIANIAITHQCDVLISGLIEWKKRDFKENGGIKEEMYRARREWQRRNGYHGQDGHRGSNGLNGLPGQTPDPSDSPHQPH